MKRTLRLMFLFLLLAVVASAQTSPEKVKPVNPPLIDFKVPLTPAVFSGKTLAQLRLMRNEIYARHGKPFKTYELHTYFMSTGWYKPDPKYSDHSLTPVELNNAAVIQAREDELLKSNYLKADGGEQVNPDNVINANQFGEFTPADREKMVRNGFIVFPTKQDQLFHIYEDNDYRGVPSFVTTDCVLHLYHLFFDFTLRSVERDYLHGAVKTFCVQMADRSLAMAEAATDEKLRRAALANAAFFDVPRQFSGGGATQLPEREKALAQEEIALGRAHQDIAPKLSPLLGHIVFYSLFAPRGHYTRGEKLKQYFLSMSWLGNAGLEVESDGQLLQTLLMVHLLHSEKVGTRSLADIWEEIYGPTVFYAGAADDLGPAEIKKVMDEIYGPAAKVGDLAGAEKLQATRARLLELYRGKAKVTGHGDWGSQKAQFRVFGQRFTPDGEIFQRLTIRDREKNFFRTFPNGLDVMAVLGSPVAREILLGELKDTWAGWPLYPGELDRLIGQYNAMNEAEWKHNLYTRWLWCLQSLVASSRDKATLPFFMKTSGWARKSLSTSLASWAELRHDTVLYSKQVVVAECGDGGKEEQFWIPEPPKGFVEPNLEFYDRMLDTLKMTREGLASRKMVSAGTLAQFGRFTEMVEFLRAVAQKELAGQPRTLREYEQIQKIGALMDSLTLGVLVDGQSYPMWDMVEGADRNMPVVADVHTGDEKALEVGVGKAQDIYVVVEIDGLLKLTRGAAFSYYEFQWPAGDRLTDERWQELLNGGQAPPLPSWTDPFRSPQREHPLPAPLYVAPEGVPAWSTQPGWKMIQYDTGC